MKKFLCVLALSATLMGGQELFAQDDNKWPAFVLNLLLGCGIGSFVQGDTVGGFIGLGGEAGGVALLLVGVTPEYTEYDDYPYYDISYPNIWMAYAGAVVLFGTRIFELVRPFTYANSFSMAVSPTIDNAGRPALAALMKFEY